MLVFPNMRFALFALLALQLYSASAQLGVTVNEAVDLKDALSKQDAEAKDLEGMLHWAIENSDPEELAKKAEEARNMDVDELRALLEERKQRVKELTEIMDSQVTETQMIKLIVVELLNSSTSLEHRMYMLKELQVMVEPIDNANDLKVMGGIAPVVEHLVLSECQGRSSACDKDSAAAVQGAAAHVIATAASNNIKFQTHLMEMYPSIFDLLVKVAHLEDSAAASKGLHALGNMIRNQEAARHAFTKAGANELLRGVIVGGHIENNVRRRALSITIDLLELDPATLLRQPGKPHTELILMDIASSCVQLLTLEDHDIQEKALHVLKAILSLPEYDSQLAVNHLILKDMAGSKLVDYQKMMDNLIEEESNDVDFDPSYYESMKALAAEVILLLSGKSATAGDPVPESGHNYTHDEL